MAVASDREMLVELIGLHARAMRRMPWVQTVLVVGIGLFTFSYLPPVLFLAWAVLTIGAEVLRATFAGRVLRDLPARDPYATHRALVFVAALAGASIGIGAVVFLPRLPLEHQAFFGIVLFATPAAGVAVSQSSRYILAAYVLCILAPAASMWGFLHPNQALGGATLVLLYCVVLITVAADGEKLLLRSVGIRHERDQLVRELQSATKLAEQSAQARGRVLAAASHDLRQPLHTLSVYSAVLASRPAPELLNEVSGNIDQIVRTLGDLLNGLLDLSRLSSGYYVPEHEAVDLVQVIGAVCAEFEHAAERKSLRLTLQLEPTRVLGDPVAIGRIARNLIDNAIKYTEQGSVCVGLQPHSAEDAPQAWLTVTDSGKGIPESEHARIFEEFYQLDNPGRDRTQGVGLGLAIVQRLCELIGATIGVESVVGRGTTFKVRFPALLDNAAAIESPAAAPPAVHWEGRRIYVVDDEIAILKSMRTLLGVWGLESLTANSPESAQQLFAQHGVPDLMIVDLDLGEGEHGARLTRRLRDEYGPFAVLIITGASASEALREANEAGFTTLQKPIAPEVLRQALVTALT
jgi:signal transduction histidine kinase/CheY-like chemotaxis protein